MMKSIADLMHTLESLDGRGYPAYKQLLGEYEGEHWRLCIEAVQGDPFAGPSRIKVDISSPVQGLPDWSLSTAGRRISTADFINRNVFAWLHAHAGRCGSGKSGVLEILKPGEQVLPRSSVQVLADGRLRIRLWIGLPAQGRRILGHRAVHLFETQLPAALQQAALFQSLDAQHLQRHVECVEDAQALREQLSARGLVAFVGNGAILPRRSGVDDRPMISDTVVPFVSPQSLQQTLPVPNAGEVTGMGIPKGITLIVGGGYHGKSTLLQALERGVYDHGPDDGRHQVITCPTAVKVRAEDGRHVSGIDISNFIGMLPGGQKTQCFSTVNASGSTSQATAIVEALEVGSKCLLMDEDTCATNFMIRDARMQRLVANDQEPIIPFIDRIGPLFQEFGVSTILVVGGAGDFFDVADTVIALDSYRVLVRSEEARHIVAQMPTARCPQEKRMEPLAGRVVQPRCIQRALGRRAARVKVRGVETLTLGDCDVDLRAVEQLVEPAQVRALGQALVWISQSVATDEMELSEALQCVMQALSEDDSIVWGNTAVGDFAGFRIFELAAGFGRLCVSGVRPLEYMQ